MNMKKQKIIRILTNLSLIFYIVYLINSLFICLVPKTASVLLNVIEPSDPLIDWAQIIGIILSALLFSLSQFLCRKEIKTGPRSPSAIGILTVLFTAVIMFVLPIGVTIFRALLYRGGILSTEGFAVLGAVGRVLNYLNVLLDPALLLLLIAYCIYWIDVITDTANVDR